jgi:hypothetical protein
VKLRGEQEAACRPIAGLGPDGDAVMRDGCGAWERVLLSLRAPRLIAPAKRTIRGAERNARLECGTCWLTRARFRSLSSGLTVRGVARVQRQREHHDEYLQTIHCLPPAIDADTLCVCHTPVGRADRCVVTGFTYDGVDSSSRFPPAVVLGCESDIAVLQRKSAGATVCLGDTGLIIDS